MNLSRILGTDVFSVDVFQCQAAASILKNYDIVDESPPWKEESLLSQCVFKILFISICHQFNWDYLQDALASWLFPEPEEKLLELEKLRASKIAHLLENYQKPERIRASERAKMLRTTASELRTMIENGALVKLIEQPTLSGPDGFYEIVKKMAAYGDDIVEKKMRVLAHDLFRENILKFSDPENLRPAIEYHLIRLYLRTGRVYPRHNEVKEILTGSPSITRDRLVRMLRLKVEEAMNYVSLYSGIDIATLNYVEWQIARSRCIPSLDNLSGPKTCRSASKSNKMPPDIYTFAASRCPFSEICFSLNQSDYGWYHEPQFEKSIY